MLWAEQGGRAPCWSCWHSDEPCIPAPCCHMLAPHAPAQAQQRAELAAQAQAEVAEVGRQRGALDQPEAEPDGRHQQHLQSRRRAWHEEGCWVTCGRVARQARRGAAHADAGRWLCRAVRPGGRRHPHTGGTVRHHQQHTPAHARPLTTPAASNPAVLVAPWPLRSIAQMAATPVARLSTSDTPISSGPCWDMETCGMSRKG